MNNEISKYYQNDSRFEMMKRLGEIIAEIMFLMEEKGLTVEEAEMVPDRLKTEIDKNGKRIEKRKPFTVFKEN